MNFTFAKTTLRALRLKCANTARFACAILATGALAVPAGAQSLPSSTAGLESRLSPAQIQKAESLIRRAESGNLTPAQTAKLRELEKRPGAGQARAQGEKLLAERRQQQANATIKVGAGDTHRRVQDPITGSGLRTTKPAATGGSYTPGASPLGGGLPGSGGVGGGGLGAAPAWAKGR